MESFYNFVSDKIYDKHGMMDNHYKYGIKSGVGLQSSQ